MTENNGEKPLFIDEILGAAQHEDAVRMDIAELIRVMRSGEQPDRETVETISQARALTRIISLGTLARFDELGAEEATELAVRLETLEMGEEGLEADMAAVAHNYEDQRIATEDPVEKRRLRMLATLSDAIFGIATMQSVRYIETTNHSHSQNLVPYAGERVAAATIELSPESAQALETLFEEVRLTIEPPKTDG